MRILYALFVLGLFTGGLSAQFQQFVSIDLNGTYSQLAAPAERVAGGIGSGLGLNYGVELPVSSFLSVRAGGGLGILQGVQHRINPEERIEENRRELKMINNQYFLSAPVALVWNLGSKSPVYLRTGLRYQFSFGQDTYGWDDDLAAANGHGRDCPGDGRVELDYEGSAALNRHQLHGELGVGFSVPPTLTQSSPRLFYEFRLTRAFNNYVEAIAPTSSALKNAPPALDNNLQSSRLWTFAVTAGTRF